MKVTSERQLTETVNDILHDLSADMDDWEVRLKGLLTLESLVESSASTDYSALFLELIAPLPPILQHQVLDRRSTVSRQACRTISKVVMAFGVQVEVFAQSLQPALFKAQSMSINVLTEVANETCRLMMENCHSQRLIPLICATMKHDKNAKLRHAASEYLLLAMKLWEPSILERQMEQIEGAIIIAIRDAMNDTREAGRACFVELARIRPEIAKKCVDRLPDSERSLKEKLRAEAIAKLGPSVFTTDGKTRTISMKTTSDLDDAAAMDDPAGKPAAHFGGLGLGRPMRVSRLEIPSPSHEKDHSISFRSARLSKTSPHVSHRRPASASSSPHVSGTRMASTPTNPAVKGDKILLKERAGRILSQRPLRMENDNPKQPSGGHVASLEDSFENKLQVSGKQDDLNNLIFNKELDAPAIFLETLDYLSRNNHDWEQRFEKFRVLESVLLEMDGTSISSNSFQLDSYGDLLAAALRDGCSDARLKISVAALGALAAALHHPEVLPGIESNLESILSCLFSRFVDSRDQLRSAAKTVLDSLPGALGLETVRNALVTVLQASKSPKVLSSAMDYCTRELMSTKDGSDPVSSPAARALLLMGVEFAKNKNLEIRQAASRLIDCLSDSDDSSAHFISKALSDHVSPSSREVNSTLDRQSIGSFENFKGSLGISLRPSNFEALLQDENSSLRSNYQVQGDADGIITLSTEDILVDNLNDLLERLAWDPRASEVAAMIVPSFNKYQVDHAVDFIEELMTSGLHEADNADVLRASLHLLYEILGQHKTEWPREESSKETILVSLLSILGHLNIEIAYAAFKCAERILDQLSPVVAVSILLAQLPDSAGHPPFEREEVAIAVGKLKLITACLERLSTGQLEGIVPKMIPLFTFYYSSANADLRRAAVSGVVAVSLRVDENMVDKHLSNLSTAQIKLIQVYVEKAKGMYDH